MKKAIQIILVIAIVVLSYFVYDSIRQPIRFKAEQGRRYAEVISRLKDIRTAQVAYKVAYGRFTGSFDTLIGFLETGKFKVVKMIGTIPDSLLNTGMTEKKALKLKLISRDTIQISVKDSLFKSSDFISDSLAFVPNSGGVKFEMACGTVNTSSKVQVQVFEAKVHNNIVLKGLDKQLIINFNDYRKKYASYAGLMVGSLNEANNNAGNWE